MTVKKVSHIKKKIGKDIDESKIIKKMNTTCLHSIMNNFLIRENHLFGMEEHLWILGLDYQHIIFSIDAIFFGKIDIAEDTISKVFRSCIRKNLNCAIVIHNYIDDKLSVTRFDKEIADKLYQCGRILNITVDDYIIMNAEKLISFKYSGVMEEVKNSLENVPKYEQIELLKKESEAIREQIFEKCKLETRIEIAKRMRDVGIDLDTVMKVTSLNVKDIEHILNGK